MSRSGPPSASRSSPSESCPCRSSLPWTSSQGLPANWRLVPVPVPENVTVTVGPVPVKQPTFAGHVAGDNRSGCGQPRGVSICVRRRRYKSRAAIESSSRQHPGRGNGQHLGVVRSPSHLARNVLGHGRVDECSERPELHLEPGIRLTGIFEAPKVSPVG